MTPDQKAAVLEVLDLGKDVTVATLREDGYPQATTVSFVHDGLTIYFGCGADSQKARNIRRSDKVSVTVDLPYEKWSEIRGLSLGGRAQIVDDPDEIERVFQAMLERFPELAAFAENADPTQMAVVRVRPEVISLLDYRRAFGHTEVIEV
jgi:PPOX class probable F420-dependent enzyme